MNRNDEYNFQTVSLSRSNANVDQRSLRAIREGGVREITGYQLCEGSTDRRSLGPETRLNPSSSGVATNPEFVGNKSFQLNSLSSPNRYLERVEKCISRDIIHSTPLSPFEIENLHLYLSFQRGNRFLFFSTFTMRKNCCPSYVCNENVRTDNNKWIFLSPKWKDGENG